MDIHGRPWKSIRKGRSMDYITVFASLIIFTGLAVLTGYNILYAVRTNGVNRQLGMSLPPIIKHMILASILASLITSLISLAILLQQI